MVCCVVHTSPVDRIRALLVFLLVYIVFVQFWILPVRQHADSGAFSGQSIDDTVSRPLALDQQHRRSTEQFTNHTAGGATSDFSSTTKNHVPHENHKTIPPIPALPWKRHSASSIDNLPYPIFVTSLPKSGTTSIWKFFKCGHVRASHNWIQRGRSSTLAGRCIHDNIRHSKPPLDHCGTYDVYTDTGYIEYDHDTGLDCFFPAVDGLEAMVQSYPNASFVHVIRDADAWYNSLQAWAHGSLFVRFRMCNATGFPDGQATRRDFLHMYRQHTERIREFVTAYPSLTYLEVQLEANETGAILSNVTGIDVSCWKDCKPDAVECQGDPPGTNKLIDRKRRRREKEKELRTVLE